MKYNSKQIAGFFCKYTIILIYRKKSMYIYTRIYNIYSTWSILKCFMICFLSNFFDVLNRTWFSKTYTLFLFFILIKSLRQERLRHHHLGSQYHSSFTQFRSECACCAWCAGIYRSFVNWREM